MRDRFEAVVRNKRGAWPTFIAGVSWEAVSIASNVDFLEKVAEKAGVWEMLKQAISVPALLLVVAGAVWLLLGWRWTRKSRATLLPQTHSELAVLVDRYADDDEGELVLRVEREERIEKTSFTLVKKTRRHA